MHRDTHCVGNGCWGGGSDGVEPCMLHLRHATNLSGQLQHLPQQLMAGGGCLRPICQLQRCSCGGELHACGGKVGHHCAMASLLIHQLCTPISLTLLVFCSELCVGLHLLLIMQAARLELAKDVDVRSLDAGSGEARLA